MRLFDFLRGEFVMSETSGKVGRPALPKNEKRWKFISCRISQDEYKEIVAAAKKSGMPKARWVRTKIVAAARRAFSLIELLCVIAIIAILAALIMAVFPKAFHSVKKLETRQTNFNNWVTNDSK